MALNLVVSHDLMENIAMSGSSVLVTLTTLMLLRFAKLKFISLCIYEIKFIINLYRCEFMNSSL